MNRIFVLLVTLAFLTTAWSQLRWSPPPEPAVETITRVPGHDSPDPVVAALAAEVEKLRPAPKKADPPPSPMQKLGDVVLQKAGAAVELAIKLIGVTAFFLGLMKVAEEGGALTLLARVLRPLMVRLFPDVPPDHPAMGAMILNMSANALGLGNAATPLGLKAMADLDRLNRFKGTASDPMVMFLAINTSSVTLVPTSVIALRQSMGSTMVADVLPTTLFATLCGTSVAIAGAMLFRRFAAAPAEITPADEIVELPPVDRETDDSPPFPAAVSAVFLMVAVAAVPAALWWGKQVAPWIIPSLVVGLLVFGHLRGVPVYEAFVRGAREGWDIAARVVPYLVAILVAVGMLDASGALGALVGLLDPITSPFGLPGAALPMALIRPLSGSAANGVLVATFADPATGPDTYTGFLVSTIAGSSETTFYVLAVYFGSVGIQRIRHALAAALCADLAGVIGSVIACKLWFAWTGMS